MVVIGEPFCENFHSIIGVCFCWNTFHQQHQWREDFGAFWESIWEGHVQIAHEAFIILDI
jgi:hypothetical protein